MKVLEVGKWTSFFSLSSVISHFVFNFSMVEEDNDSFGFDALELDGKQNAVVWLWDVMSSSATDTVQ